MRMLTDYNLERNITSSDVDFLEGEDEEKKSNAKVPKKKNKPENAHVSVDNAKHVLTTPDLSGLEHKADSDVVMNDVDIMSVLDLIIDKELTLSHTARRSPQIASP
jgi:hypothetical protein